MKLLFPTFAKNITADVVLNLEGVSEDGSPYQVINKQLKGIYSERSRTVYDKDGKAVTSVGNIIFEGNIAENLYKLSDGDCTINGIKYSVVATIRPRNPDGTVFYTKLELM